MGGRKKRESISKKLIFNISGLLCVVYVLVFIAISGINYGLKIRSEKQNNRTYLCNTLLSIDDKIKDISRVSLMTMADDRTLGIISGYRNMDEAGRLDAIKYLKSFYTSLTIIRNDICGIYIMDDEDMIFHFDDADSAKRRDMSALSIPDQIATMQQEPMTVDNCRIIIDRQPSFMRFNGEYISNPYYSTCLWMVRDIYKFSPHERVGEIVLTAPVDRLDYICSATLSPDCFYLLLTQNGKVVSSRNADDLLLTQESLIGDGIPNGGSGYVHYGDEVYYATCLLSPESGLKLIVGRSAKSIFKELFKLVPVYFLCCLATLIIAIFITRHLVHRVIKPVTELADIMEKFNTEAMSKRLPVVSDDETGRLISGYNAMMDTIQNQIEREYRDEVRLRDAKMREQRMTMLYLKSQINPHFLYNTLDTIRISAQINKDTTVSDMLMHLVAFFRLSMRFNQSIVTVEHELELLDNYLALMHYRYTDIESEVNCDPELEDIELPNFILQPVVENSILHGLRDKGYKGKISIDVSETSDDHIVISVLDNGIGMSPEEKRRIEEMLSDGDEDHEHHSSIGLRNVQHRLRLFYDETCGLEFRDGPEGGTAAMITIRKHISHRGDGTDQCAT